MIGRLLALVVVGLMALSALGASSSGDGAESLGRYQTAADVRQEQAAELERRRQIAEAQERDRRYREGEMSAEERAEYEAALVAAERQRAFERQQARAAAAAAAAARSRSVRGTRSSGGGFSSGK